MKIVTSKELAKVPNGSLILDLCQTKRNTNNCINFYSEDLVPRIFCGNYACKKAQEKGLWNGICYLYPFGSSVENAFFLKEDIDSNEDFYTIDKDDILFSVDTDSNDYDEDALFAVYSEEEKQNFVKELMHYLGYSLKDLKKILRDA